MVRLSIWQKIFSQLFPVRVCKHKDARLPYIELYYFRGQWQLATPRAMYSDGHRYRPLRIAFEQIKKQLPQVHDMLMLGTGLGSAAMILDKMGYHPTMVFVEMDETIIEWAKEVLPERQLEKLTMIAADAEVYMRDNTHQYDLIVVDVFINCTVPDFVTQKHFLSSCQKALRPEGIMVLNYIIEDKAHWQEAISNIKEVFPQTDINETGVNRIIISGSQKIQ